MYFFESRLYYSDFFFLQKIFFLKINNVNAENPSSKIANEIIQL